MKNNLYFFHKRRASKATYQTINYFLDLFPEQTIKDYESHAFPNQMHLNHNQRRRIELKIKIYKKELGL